MGDLNKLRGAFHNELTATAEELSKAMAFYASRSMGTGIIHGESYGPWQGARKGRAAARLKPVLRSSGKRRQPNVGDEPPKTLTDSCLR